MRRALFILLFSMIFCPLFSQELVVQTFRVKTTDLEAKISPEYDLNKEACALIKVAIIGSNVEFEGNIIKEKKHSQGEYYIYMPAGSKRLKVNSSSFLPLVLEFSDYDIKLESNVTYELRIITPQIKDILPSIEKQFLVMSVAPPEATVFINNVPRDVVDGVVSIDLVCGTYNYKIECPLYETAEGTFEIVPEHKSEISVELKDLSGKIVINSSPVTGAKVFIDGIQVGVTPFESGPVSAGFHDIRITNSGYYVYSEQVMVESGKTARLDAELNASFSKITLVASQLDAEIVLDGVIIGKGVWEGVIDPGKHLVETRKSGFIDSNEIIEVKRETDERFKLAELMPMFGILGVSSSPIGATIYIDGAVKGETPFRTNEIPVGRHSLEVKKDGFKPYIESFTVSLNEPLDIFANLKAEEQHRSDAEKVTGASSSIQKKTEPGKGLTYLGVLTHYDRFGNLSFGLMGAWVKRFGAYVSVSSNFSTGPSASFECDRKGFSESGEFHNISEDTIVSKFSIAAGPVFRLAKPLYLYGGAGYYNRTRKAEEIPDHRWGVVSDYSYSGVSFDIGTIIKIGRIGFGVGAVIPIGGDFITASANIGLMF